MRLFAITASTVRSYLIPYAPRNCVRASLNWDDVRPLIVEAFSPLPDVRVLLYAPHPAPVAEAMPVGTEAPAVTRARALLLLLIHRYHEPGYKLTMLEVQKLAYFLQAAGEALRLRYVKHKYGPYADNLNHAVQRLEGHLLRGYGDRTGKAGIQTMPGAVEQATAVIGSDQEAIARLERVSQLIEGFENPYGMELLASLHWLAAEDPDGVVDVSVATDRLYSWTDRKKKLFRSEHIRKAWERLRQQGWLGDRAN